MRSPLRAGDSLAALAAPGSRARARHDDAARDRDVALLILHLRPDTARSRALRGPSRGGKLNRVSAMSVLSDGDAYRTATTRSPGSARMSMACGKRSEPIGLIVAERDAQPDDRPPSGVSLAIGDRACRIEPHDAARPPATGIDELEGAGGSSARPSRVRSTLRVPAASRAGSRPRRRRRPGPRCSADARRGRRPAIDLRLAPRVHHELARVARDRPRARRTATGTSRRKWSGRRRPARRAARRGCPRRSRRRSARTREPSATAARRGEHVEQSCAPAAPSPAVAVAASPAGTPSRAQPAAHHHREPRAALTTRVAPARVPAPRARACLQAVDLLRLFRLAAGASSIDADRRRGSCRSSRRRRRGAR